MRITARDFVASYTVTRPFRAPFHRGGLLHGLFGRALRPVACAAAAPCPERCAARATCAWSRLFDPAPAEPPPHPLLRGMQDPPARILVRAPAPGAEDLAPGAEMEIHVRLLGDEDGSAALVERALAAVATLPVGTEQGRMAFRAIRAPEAQSHALVPSHPEPGPERRLTVHFETPARLKRDGKLVDQIDFPLLFAQIWRRASVLAALYGEIDAEDDRGFPVLLARAARIRTTHQRLRRMDWQHLSMESGQQKPLRGVLGEVVFEGDLTPFLPALAMAQVIHVGGATSFGLGRLRVEE